MRSLLLLLCSLLAASSWGQKEYAPIDSLDVDAYMGRWYQMYTNLGFVLLELGGRCTTADYTLRDDGKIALINQSRPLLLPRFLARTTGFVVQSESTAGAFTVDQGYLFALDPEQTTFEDPGNYWIIGIGPVVDGQYQWAVVSDPNKSSCFVLARDVANFASSGYEEDALQVFQDFGGFDNFFVNQPLPTKHSLCFGY